MYWWAFAFCLIVVLLSFKLRKTWNKYLRAHHAVRDALEKAGKKDDLQSFQPWLRDNDEMGFLESVQFALGVCTLFPLRFFLLFWAFIIAGVFVKVSNNRAAMVKLFKPLARLALFCFSVCKITEKGRRKDSMTKPAAPIVIGNHVTYVDPFYMIYAFAPSFVAKASAGKIPIVGDVARGLKVIWASRNEKEGLSDKIGERVKVWQEKEGHENVTPLSLFPEGTTTSGNCVLKFKTGAFVNKSPVQIVALKYGPKTPFNRAWGSDAMPLPLHTLRMMSTPYTELTAVHLPVHVPSEAEKADPGLFSRNARSKLSAVLQYKSVEEDYATKVKLMDMLKRARSGQPILEENKKEK